MIPVMPATARGRPPFLCGSVPIKWPLMSQPDSAATPPDPAGFSNLETVFEALGRVLIILSRDFRVLRASKTIDAIAYPGASLGLIGSPIEDLIGSELFGPGGQLRSSLAEGRREEGRRAVLRCGPDRARLVSLTAAPIPRDVSNHCDPRAWYLVVIRPAEEDDLLFQGAAASFGLVARSPVMLQLVHLVESLHRSDATVLITGESGTGKEIIARALHDHSPRRSGPFVAVNCAALPADLLESELFGHVRGAFTGAVRDRIGRFEAAAGGTLFLDEIGELPLQLQAKLLRVLQERTFERVGESTTRKSDARVIAATNRDLRRAATEGRFREDLYYRLRVVPLEVPPLRERDEDIEPLARSLVARICARYGRALRLSPEALQVLLNNRWPGNVRELENALEYAIAVCKGQTILPEDLPPELLGRSPEERRELPEAPSAPSEASTRERLLAALEANHWRRSETADALGVSRTTLWRMMREAGLKD
jgi:transcriptional regulator with PAS, ATPase and Fis domain